MSSSASRYTDLLVVCCHAVYTGDQDWPVEDAWLLKDFQKSVKASGKIGEHHTFVGHIHAAIMAAVANPRALIVFSGGKTTSHPRSEARGYADIMSRLISVYNLPQLGHETEDLATDSHQNLFFSLLKFRSVTGHYPRSITVITHAFKEKRFLECHAPAIKWPSSKIRVQGINPPFTLSELEEVEHFEYKNAYKAFKEENLYGRASALAQKQQQRNWDPEAAKNLELAADFEPAVTQLLHWTGGTTGLEIFPERLPWEED